MENPEIYILFMIKYYRGKQTKYTPKNTEKKIKNKKNTKKVEKINKKWFISNFTRIITKLDIYKLFGVTETNASIIYSKYFNEKKPTFCEAFYQHVNFMFLEDNNIKRPVTLN